ncbi:NepR family anti-sigma factor [Brevirhabdus sp.]
MKDRDPSTVSRQIDENLKRVYQEVVEEDLPDRFKDLLSKLQQQSGKK